MNFVEIVGRRAGGIMLHKEEHGGAAGGEQHNNSKRHRSCAADHTETPPNCAEEQDNFLGSHARQLCLLRD